MFFTNGILLYINDSIEGETIRERKKEELIYRKILDFGFLFIRKEKLRSENGLRLVWKNMKIWVVEKK